MDHLVDDHADDDADAAAADDDDHYYCHYVLLWYNDLHEQQWLFKQIYNEFEQALTNQHKSAKVVAIWFVDDIVTIWLWILVGVPWMGGGLSGLSKLQLPMVCCADIKKGILFPSPGDWSDKSGLQIGEHSATRTPCGGSGRLSVTWWRGWGDSHPVGEVDSDPVPGLEELLSKIAKDEQVWYQSVSKSQQGNHMID